MVQVHIKQSKTDPFRQGVHLHLGKTGELLCQVSAILAYVRIRGLRPGPLFVFSDGSYLTRQRFAALVAKALGRAGFNTQHYSTHSFRIGAATSAKDSGISDAHIKMLGRWKSEAYHSWQSCQNS